MCTSGCRYVHSAAVLLREDVGNNCSHLWNVCYRYFCFENVSHGIALSHTDNTCTTLFLSTSIYTTDLPDRHASFIAPASHTIPFDLVS